MVGQRSRLVARVSEVRASEVRASEVRVSEVRASEVRASEVSHAESHWTINPRPWSWDARAGIAHGPWQLWGRPELTLEEQARAWLHNVEAAGLASVDSSPRRAARRAVRAARLLTE